MSYFVYIIKCADNTYYCGYTTNLARRLAEHNGSKKGAKYTKGKGPVELKYCEELPTLSEALKREHAVKRMPRAEKIKLIAGQRG